MTSEMIFAGLFLACCIYAYILNLKPVYRWYHRRKIWVTVVIGCGFILAALYLHVEIGTIPLSTWRLVFWHFVAAGIPIIVWQWIKGADQEEAERKIEQEEERRKRGA